jgi:hypothetical protein
VKFKFGKGIAKPIDFVSPQEIVGKIHGKIHMKKTGAHKEWNIDLKILMKSLPIRSLLV